MNFFKNFAQKTVDAVKEVSVEDASKKLDVAGDLATLGIFLVLTIGAFRSRPKPKIKDIDIPDSSSLYVTTNNYYYGRKE